ncbi:hypothetical protein EDB19DRAFT_1919118 [Suillus lakei]|nr:hypothetical protein EDB19DRAFT_1919118 [Suillus lakei]
MFASCAEGTTGLTSEEITAKRRAERKRFELDRAKMIAAAGPVIAPGVTSNGTRITPSAAT